MLRQLHIAIVYGLTAMLITVSLAQTVCASDIGVPVPSHGSHDGSHHTHKTHDHSVDDQKSRRDCLEFCLDAVSDHYLAPELFSPPGPNFGEDTSIKFGVFREAIILQPSAYARDPGGPPGGLKYNVGRTGVRTLLLRNARLRN